MKRKMTLTSDMVLHLELTDLCSRFAKVVDGETKILFHVPQRNIKAVARKLRDAKIRVKTITIFQNPEGEWLKIKEDELDKLGIREEIEKSDTARIRHGKHPVADVYLDEKDAEVYRNAVKKRFDNKVVFQLFVNDGGKFARMRGYDLLNGNRELPVLGEITSGVETEEESASESEVG